MRNSSSGSPKHLSHPAASVTVVVPVARVPIHMCIRGSERHVYMHLLHGRRVWSKLRELTHITGGLVEGFIKVRTLFLFNIEYITPAYPK